MQAQGKIENLGNCETNNMTVNGNNASGSASTMSASAQSTIMPIFPNLGYPEATQQPTMASSVPINPHVPIKHLSLAEMESIISPFTKRRSENFALQEVMLLIKEIGKRSHIILSRNPSDRKLKKKAWEEVANSMALKRPHEPRRTGEQVGHHSTHY